MNRKLLFFPLATLVLLSLFACTPDEPSLPDPLPPVVEPEKPKDIYDRAGIIAGNKTLEYNTFLDSDVWAIEWAKSRYAASDVVSATAEDMGGTVLSDVLVEGNLQLVYYTWNVKVTLSGGANDVIPVQTLYYISEKQMYLSGLLAKDDIVTTQESAYDYFKTDSRLTSLMKPFPYSDFSDNVTEISGKNLSHGNFDYMYLLGNDTLAAIKSSYAEDKTITCSIQLMNVATGNVFKTIEYTTSGNKRTYLVGETLVLEYVDYIDSTSIVRHTISPSGAQDKVLTSDKLNEKTLPGGARIVEESNSVYWLNPATTEKRLLLEGIDAQDETSQVYKLSFPIDETRFAYSKMGWEAILNCGIYDISSKTEHIITPPQGVDELYPLKTVGDVLYCAGKVYKMDGMSKSVVLTATSLSTYETTLLLPQTVDFEFVDVSPDGLTAAYMLTKDNRTKVSVYNIATGALVTTAEIYSPFESLGIIRYVSGDTLQLWANPYSGSTPVLYKLSLPKTVTNLH